MTDATPQPNGPARREAIAPDTRRPGAPLRATPVSTTPATRSGWVARLWFATPDWVFRVMGAGFFFTYLATRLPEYSDGFWQACGWYRFAGGFTLYFPYRALVDITYLLIALAFCFRLKPLARAARAREIVLPVTVAFWPFLPFAIQAVLQTSALQAAAPEWSAQYEAFMFSPTPLPAWQFITGSALLVIGNVFDVWGYAVLFRSISIVAEARVLKVTGPYRIVRHPIYFGQFLSQGGLWLFYANTHLVWVCFYLCFVVMQLYRARIEEDVLERTFGETYGIWKRKTFWFI